MATCAAWSAAAADATNVLVTITLCIYPPLSRLMLPWSFLPFVLVAMVAPLAKYHEPVLLLMLLAGPLAFIYATLSTGEFQVQIPFLMFSNIRTLLMFVALTNVAIYIYIYMCVYIYIYI